MKLTVETRNTKKFNALISFLRTNGYKVKIDESIALKEEDWVIPGRPATDKEHELLAIVMEKETDGDDADAVFDRILKKYSHEGNRKGKS